MADFVKYPKTPRLYREVVITEKIDGTNGCIVIEEKPFGASVVEDPKCIAYILSQELAEDGLPVSEYHIYAQSRNRFLTVAEDNHGFAAWVGANYETLFKTLGPGRWYGEWWGQGINRGYGMNRKKFSLFGGSAARLASRPAETLFTAIELMQNIGMEFVPTISTGIFSDELVEDALGELASSGSWAAVGFDRPEGIIVYHTDSNQVFKVLLEHDNVSKTEAGL